MHSACAGVQRKGGIDITVKPGVVNGAGLLSFVIAES